MAPSLTTTHSRIIFNKSLYMKKFITCICVILFAAFFKPASAQFQASNNVQDQPKWGPSGHEFVEYYYLPDIDTYYYVPGKQFIYQSGGYWTFSSSLPKAKKNYNLRSGNKVVVNEPGAYRYFAEHKAKYGSSQSNASVLKDEAEKKDKQEKQIASSSKKSS